MNSDVDIQFQESNSITLLHYENGVKESMCRAVEVLKSSKNSHNLRDTEIYSNDPLKETVNEFELSYLKSDVDTDLQALNTVKTENGIKENSGVYTLNKSMYTMYETTGKMKQEENTDSSPITLPYHPEVGISENPKFDHIIGKMKQEKSRKDKTEQKNSRICDICGSKFTRKESLKKHILTIHEGKKPYECSACNYKSAQRGAVDLHIINIHRGEKAEIIDLETNLFKCNMCSFSAKSTAGFQRHILKVHEEKKKIFSCQICRKSFLQKGSLLKHKIAVHEDKKTTFA